MGVKCKRVGLQPTRCENRRASTMEQVMGIEPTSKAWEALILPMNYTCERYYSIKKKRKCKLNTDKIL